MRVGHCRALVISSAGDSTGSAPPSPLLSPLSPSSSTPDDDDLDLEFFNDRT
eukprot:CAMPEP_0119555060 /NCGR_PEP_ID=MMETSP1352-20130426/7389_1 /TAXON_ID=265584 /ORGANISM="Stauroneis constricta, Strain CCMP1120" /LENGTH=51 /DNA_ID=CAMNT_0007601763 /DNA_START=48 /DNA_END=199 /DNA_ORIENTATION=-